MLKEGMGLHFPAAALHHPQHATTYPLRAGLPPTACAAPRAAVITRSRTIPAVVHVVDEKPRNAIVALLPPWFDQSHAAPVALASTRHRTLGRL